MSILVETSLGNFIVDLFIDERKLTCTNFIKLCKRKYYNNCLFHSVQKGLVAQTGDPTGTCRGGSSVFGLVFGDQARFFQKESVPVIKHRKAGMLSMVNNGDDKHGSQFFITLNVDLDSLDKSHTVFGQITEGMDIIEKFNDVFCDSEDRPYKNIRIHHTIILSDPFPDPPGLDAPSETPPYVPDIQLYTEPGVAPRIEEDEPLDEDQGLTEEQLTEKIAETNAKANAKLLTLIGDIPDADIKPPENVLFVCKLNPVTTAEDLEIIFSRFGEIKSCEVIKDKRSGNSLQYAFIEFEEEKSCEQAFLKMENVVIDDRRYATSDRSFLVSWSS
ncbi:Peptidyl-prolyl cis-trans isomerase-like 4 [Cichlidogyrus casuarinus]|uniref:Peptidyl-prolyl cis-trans isomerase n=1 Tax=Cichlidogyrus casuarinus TaxID=1844966 RepID=A0ABD2QNS1_9PLAT